MPQGGFRFGGLVMKQQYHRAVSFFAVALVYAAAAAFGLFVYRKTGGSPLVRLFLADAAATVLVYLFSLPLSNASVYDPYWSVAPIVILPLAITEFGTWNFGSVCLFFCVGYWGAAADGKLGVYLSRARSSGLAV